MEGPLESDGDLVYYVPDPHFTKRRERPMPHWQRALYAFLYRNARAYSDYLGIPPDQVVRVGVDASL